MARRRKKDNDEALAAMLVLAALVGCGVYKLYPQYRAYVVLYPQYRAYVVWSAIAVVALLITAIALMFWWRRQTAKTLMGWLAVADQMAALSPIEFERACAELFRNLGYRVSLTPTSGDDGVDVLLEKDGEREIVQCKHYQERWVGSPEVRDLLGAKQNSRAANAYLLTSNFFSDDALELARRNEGLYLWDRDKLTATASRLVREELLRRQPAAQPPAESLARESVGLASENCPRCGRELVIKHGRRGRFMSCSGFPQCRYSRDLTESELAGY